MSVKDYYDTMIKCGNDGQCKECGSPTKFLYEEKRILAYNEFCSKSCRFSYTHKQIQSDSVRREEWADRSRDTMKAMWNNPDQAEKWKREQSERSSNQLKDPNCSWGKYPGMVPLVKYKGITMRSKWEVNFATEMDSLDIQWVYEYKSFTLWNGRKYTPDFYLPDFNLLVEIKPSLFVDEHVEAKIKFLRLYGYEICILTESNWTEFVALCKYFSLTRKNSHVIELKNSKREK
jgi:hypothetical protein